MILYIKWWWDIFNRYFQGKKLNSFQYLFLDNFSIPGCLWAVRKAWGFWWCFVGRKRSCSHRLHAGRQRKVGRKFEPKTRGKKPNVFSWLYAECRKEEGNARASCVALSIKKADQPLYVRLPPLRAQSEFSVIVKTRFIS